MLIILVGFLFLFPFSLKPKPSSTALFDKNHNLLSAHVSKDEQWHFLSTSGLPKKYEVCLLQFEDRNFYHHFGVRPKSILRAIIQNIRHGKTISGGSTITMQSVRISLNNPSRTYIEKVREMLLAIRVEVKYSKKEILQYYAGNAPFGNNIIGLEAATWRYFGKPPKELSWAESATLAVLPNAPGLIYPGRNHQELYTKRNRLLYMLKEKGILTEDEFLLSIAEPLPEKPKKLPSQAPHLLQYLAPTSQGSTSTTIDGVLQEGLINMIENKQTILQDFNIAILVTDLQNGHIVSYIGNNPFLHSEMGKDVDCVHASRSSGSILKPILYGLSIDEGIISPESLLPDIPTYFGNFSPKNYHQNYAGAISAKTALSKSLNIPMVYLLKDYGVGKFQHELTEMGISSLHRNSKAYGLSLILGGAEVTLWDINKLYTSMAYTVLGKTGSIQVLADTRTALLPTTMSKISIYHTFEAMKEVSRPDEEGNWQFFNSSKPIAWKTGTSFGNRDAWAVGVTPDYVVSIWVGKASGEGDPLLTGYKMAAPLLFEIYSKLPVHNKWFSKPNTSTNAVRLCSTSGYIATSFCSSTHFEDLPAFTPQKRICPYHKPIYTTMDEQFTIRRNVENMVEGKLMNYFQLPPMMEKFYAKNHPEYVKIPPKKGTQENDAQIEISYPKSEQHIFTPARKDEEPDFIAEATHKENTTLYWHLDEMYLGETGDFHKMGIQCSLGKHQLMVQDQNGNEAKVVFYMEK